jgi:protein-S-isoprenylcysteine O-methyltransferase Ste14
MSHRTNPLPPLEGLPRIVRELRYHEASRQILGLLICVVFALTAHPRAGLTIAGTPLVLAGVGLRMWASGIIIKNRNLATSGPYRYVRHPQYVGNILIITAFVFASGNWWTAPVALAFLLFYYPPAIEYEERKLGNLFGRDWDEYARTTHSLLPSFSARPQAGAMTWSLRKSLLRNLEPLTAAFILGLFVHVFTRL